MRRSHLEIKPRKVGTAFSNKAFHIKQITNYNYGKVLPEVFRHIFIPSPIAQFAYLSYQSNKPIDVAASVKKTIIELAETPKSARTNLLLFIGGVSTLGLGVSGIPRMFLSESKKKSPPHKSGEIAEDLSGNTADGLASGGISKTLGILYYTSSVIIKQQPTLTYKKYQQIFAKEIRL